MRGILTVGFLRRVAVLSLTDRVRSLTIWKELKVELLLLHTKKSLFR